MRRRGAVPLLSVAFFYGYTGMCAVAGAAGAAFGRSDVARPVDGPPRANAYVFGRSELLRLAVIFVHTRSTLRR